MKRSVLKKAAIAVCFVAACGMLLACSGSAKYYQLDKFASQDTKKILETLDSDLKLDYLENSTEYIDYVWGGLPSDTPTDCDGILAHFKDAEGNDISRENLEYGEAEITEAFLYLQGADLGHMSDASSMADDLMKECGFKDTLWEGLVSSFGDGWVRIGKCKLNGADAYWGIGFPEDGGVYIAVKQLGEKAYGDLADDGVNLVSLMI